MARKLRSGVLEAFCKYTEDTEVPAVFAVWSAIATVSAVLGRNVFVDQGFFVIYPNIYTVLVAGSAKCRKSTSIGIAEDFLKEVRPQINLLSQKMTPEGLIAALGGMFGSEGDTQVIPAAIGIAIVDEFSTLIDKNSFKNGMIALLTDLYDAKDFEYLTRSRGKEMVRNPCLSILGGSTIQWIKESIPVISIGGGFTSRFVFVYKDQRERLVPWPTMTEENRKRRLDIIHDLNEIAKLQGAFGLEPKALELYKKEYVEFYEHSPLMDDSALTGYAGRRHHILLKVSIVVSASRRDDKLITQSDMVIAMNFMRRAEKMMPKILRAIESEKVGDVYEEILQFIIRRKIVDRTEVVRRFRHKMTAFQIEEMMRTVEAAGAIKIEVDGRKTRYVFIGKEK